MTNPELENESIWIIRESETGWKTIGCRRPGGAGHDYNSPVRNKDTRQLVDLNIGVNRIEVVHILLVEMAAISQTNAPPTFWEELDARNCINRIIVECVRRMAADVLGAFDFANDFDVFGERKVKCQAAHYLIGPIQQDHVIAHRFALRVAVQDVPDVRGQINTVT